MRTNPLREKVGKHAEEVKQFEQELVERHRQLMREEMGLYLEAKDRESSREVVALGGYESKGLRSRQILSSVGKVTVRVRRYRRGNGATVYPLRDVCGIDGMTPVAKAYGVRLAVERSYGWSVETLKELCGMRLSRMRLWQVVQKEGQKEQERVEGERKRIFEEAGGERESPGDENRAVIELDGTMISSREALERDEFGRKRMEAKLGVMFRGITGKKRRKTLKRKVYARIADVNSFSEQYYAHCSLNGVSSSEVVQVLGDGADWIRTVKMTGFPRARYTLDWYHLKAYAKRVLLEHQQRMFLTLVKTNLVQTAVKYLKELHPSDRRHREALQGFVHYVETNIDGINYPKSQIHASGVIEKMADLVVKKRMKRQGMSWSQKGANNILALRTRHINDDHSRISLAVSPP